MREPDFYYKCPTRGVSVTLYLGDCRRVIPGVSASSVVITDPVWPNCPHGMLNGSDGLQGILLRAALDILDMSRTWVVVLGFDSDPRWLAESVPPSKPFLRTQQMPYAFPAYRGRLLAGDEVAYVFGAIPRGRGVIPGRLTTEPIPKSKRPVNHPCPRSVTHMVSLMRWWTEDDDTVVDPFMGSGTTGIAAVKCGRNFIGIEIDPSHFNTAKERIERELRQDVFDFHPPGAPMPVANRCQSELQQDGNNGK